MSMDWKALAQEVNKGAGALFTASPDTIKAFGELAKAATADASLSKKIKELMAVAISVVIRCEGCIAYHTQSAIAAGATREEFAETISVAIELGGGPATVYGAQALEAFEQLGT